MTIILFTGLMTSCEDYLDKQPTGDLTLDDVFASRMYSKGFLSNIYHRLPAESNMAQNWNHWIEGGLFCGNPFVAGSDEMEISIEGSFVQRMNDGSWNPTNIANGGVSCDIYRQMYQAVRMCNIFLERVDNIPTTDEEKSSWKGEAYFLRAFFHFFIMRTHGPIVILDRSLSTDEEVNKITRRPIQEVAQFIAKDCNSAAEFLVDKPKREIEGEVGRVTSVAALALKSRVLLYAASPLWNGNPNYANFMNPNGEKLVSTGEDKDLWKIAADAAFACIAEAESNGYALYYDPSGDPYDNYSNIWNNYYNCEWLFWKQQGEFFHADLCADPVGFQYSAGWYAPTQNIVDAYQMADGSTPILGYESDGVTPIINTATGYTEDHFVNAAERASDLMGKYYRDGVWSMYKGREPRFYASINFNLQFWKTRQIEFWYAGRDGRSKSPTGDTYCKTGYLMRKIVDATYRNSLEQYRNKNWIYFRLGEIYLNYAEALFEFGGDEGEVRWYVNAIRSRAGLPPISCSGDDLRKAIRHERRIELAFETHRWFDTRRWKEIESQKMPVSGMNIAAGTNPNANINKTDESFYRRTKIEDRIFEPQHYLFPIPQEEINRNLNNLVQNPWWH